MASAEPGELDERTKRFCELYLLTFNGTQAFKQAGYKAKNDVVAGSGAYRLLKKDQVRAYLAHLSEATREKAVTDIVEVVTELRRILVTDLADAVDDEGTLLPLKKWPVDLRRALAGIENEELFEFIDGQKVVTGTLRKVKLWSKTDAAQQLLRHLGGFEKDNAQQAESIAELVAATMDRDKGAV